MTSPQMNNSIKPGTRAIAEARLESFENRTPDRDYTVQFTIPEFTCLCPMTGFPDFATLHIRYVPKEFCVELKSLKLYINGFRDQGMFHEDVVTGILQDLVDLLGPRYCEVVGDFNVRGKTTMAAGTVKIPIRAILTARMFDVMRNLTKSIPTTRRNGVMRRAVFALVGVGEVVIVLQW